MHYNCKRETHKLQNPPLLNPPLLNPSLRTPDACVNWAHGQPACEGLRIQSLICDNILYYTILYYKHITST